MIKLIPQDQKRELLRMLSNLNSWDSWKHRCSYKRRPLPAHLRAAQQQINRWERHERLASERVDNLHRKALERIRQEIFFGTPEKALALIRKASKVSR